MYYAQAQCVELNGTNYEIGNAIGRIIAGIPPLKATMAAGPGLDYSDFTLAEKLFDPWCPGLNEEILGMADALSVSPKQITFYAMTYLRPACSQIALPPPMTADGHVLMARNYEFSHRLEDFTLARTSVKGKFAHIGSTVMQLGRDEGLNEQGLGVTMSSCGFPVGTPENMRRPALRGLQFWAVIRTLLENCKDTDDALEFIKGMPIAYNINMILADAKGRLALVETLDGNVAVKRGDDSEMLYAANHVLLPGLQQYEKTVMRNSVQRCETIEQRLGAAKGADVELLKSLLLQQYPEGLNCRDYDGFFGTTKSIVMDVTEGKLSICWGGLVENGWQSHSVHEPLICGAHSVKLAQEAANAGFYDMIPSVSRQV